MFRSRLLAIGADRLNELGFTTDSIPAELRADWSDEEIDIIVDSLDGCVDIEAITKTALLADVSEQDQNCILGEIGNDFFLITLTEQGPGAVPSDDTESLTVSVVMEVTEIEGVWWVVGSDNDLLDSFSCL